MISKEINRLTASHRLQTDLSSAEFSVLSVFQDYLMTPGKMLCFGSQDLVTFDTALGQLTEKGLLVAEDRQGGYSLTKTGFAAMQTK